MQRGAIEAHWRDREPAPASSQKLLLSSLPEIGADGLQLEKPRNLRSLLEERNELRMLLGEYAGRHFPLYFYPGQTRSGKRIRDGHKSHKDDCCRTSSCALCMARRPSWRALSANDPVTRAVACRSLSLPVGTLARSSGDFISWHSLINPREISYAVPTA